MNIFELIESYAMSGDWGKLEDLIKKESLPPGTLARILEDVFNLGHDVGVDTGFDLGLDTGSDIAYVGV